MTKQVEIYVTSKTCSRCNVEKDIDSFTALKPRRNRKDPTKFYNQTTGTHDCWCKQCRLDISSEKRMENPGPILSVLLEDRKLMTHIRYLRSAAKARRKDLTVTDTYLLQLMKDQEYKCPYTGLPFSFKRDKNPLVPSLDRIDSSQGYHEGNVEFVCWAINRAKSDMSKHDFIVMCKRVSEKNQ